MCEGHFYYFLIKKNELEHEKCKKDKEKRFNFYLFIYMSQTGWQKKVILNKREKRKRKEKKENKVRVTCADAVGSDRRKS